MIQPVAVLWADLALTHEKKAVSEAKATLLHGLFCHLVLVLAKDGFR